MIFLPLIVFALIVNYITLDCLLVMLPALLISKKSINFLFQVYSCTTIHIYVKLYVF